MFALHAFVLLDDADRDFIENVIKPKMDLHIIKNNIFECRSNPGGYGHHDGLRGIVTDEAHMRSAGGYAMVMRKFDEVTNTSTYCDTDVYRNIVSWIMQMKSDIFFYEFEQLPERKKSGKGECAQYVPIWWITGKI